uniref:limonene-1,2-epoxide hydrolase family protein n=1 Tax=uncultured Sphingomonas sp. TaxID=158754 RepID=UPI0035CA33D9
MSPQSSECDLVVKLIQAWERRDADAVSACFAEGGIWHNMPYAPIVGRTAIGAAIRRFLDQVEQVRFDLHLIAKISPGIVVTERNDIFVMKDGRQIDIAVMGVFEIAGNAILAWRDYFDGAAMNAPPAATTT